MSIINMSDCDALVEACVCDGYSFGQITKMVRDEWVDCGVSEAITVTIWSLRSIVSLYPNTAVSATARSVLNDWTTAHPNIAVPFAPAMAHNLAIETE